MFDPADFAAVADHLCSSATAGACPAEAAYRAASGRYYYAVLLAARNYLEASGPMPVSHEQTHQTVIRALRESNDPIAARLTSEMMSLRNQRNLADYGDEISDPQTHARRMGEGCRRALKLVDTLSHRIRR